MVLLIMWDRRVLYSSIKFFVPVNYISIFPIKVSLELLQREMYKKQTNFKSAKGIPKGLQILHNW